MSCHDVPVTEVKRLLEEDRRKTKNYVHECEYTITVKGQSREWQRCKCGSWKDENYGHRYAE